MWIGSNKNNISNPFNIVWTTEPVKFLGIYVGYNKRICEEKKVGQKNFRFVKYF